MVNRNSTLLKAANKIKDDGFGNKDALHIASALEVMQIILLLLIKAFKRRTK